MRKQTFVINKIHLAERPKGYTSKFPRQPQLYLDLIENKKRVKPELVNKPYEPPILSPEYNNDSNNPIAHFYTEAKYQPENSIKDLPCAQDTTKAEISTPNTISTQTSQQNSPANSVVSLTPIENADSKEDLTIPNPVSSKVLLESPNSLQSQDSSKSSKGKLFNMLKRNDSFSKKYTPQRVEKEDIPIAKIAKTNARCLPSLRELEQQNKVKIPQEFINVSAIKEEDENKKRELLFKFDILRKTYPRADIRTYTIYDSYTVMKDYYDGQLKLLSLDSSVENYKTYLTFAFMGMEFALGKWFKLDMKGFTEQQLVNINKYEKLLVEIGEKSYIPSGKKWPVEIRLLILVVIQTALFIIGRSLFGGAGAKILGSVTDMKVPPATSGDRPAPRKMKGPRINVNEIP